MSYLDIARKSLEDLRSGVSEAARSGEAEAVSASSVEAAAAMSLATFARAGLILHVDSEVLGTTVLFVSDNVPESAITDRGLTVYRASELRKLAILKPSPRSLRTIHDAKTIFDGVITDA